MKVVVYKKRSPQVSTGEYEMAMKGKVKWFNEQKGYGFIAPDEGGKELFVHRSNVNNAERLLNEGQTVEFESRLGRKGPEAVEVTVA